MDFIIVLLIRLLNLYFWVVCAAVAVSWLTVFNVLNTRNIWVYKGCKLLNAITDPPMRYLRKIVPPIGGIDITPMIIIFGIYFLENILYNLL